MNKKASFFKELLIGIYKSDRIKYEQKLVYIEGKSLYGKCDFEKTDKYVIYRAWFNELFRLTFLDEETEFSIDREGGSYNIDKPKKGQIQFTRKDAIINTALFWKKHGVDFNILTNEDVTKFENIKMIIYTSLWIVTSYFCDFIDDKIKKNEFIEFMDNQWYDTCKDCSFYDSHKNDQKTYTGYWCWLAAAIIKMKSIKDISGKYIPVEVI
jgi:hypothetical protein